MKIITRCEQKAEPDLNILNLVNHGAYRGVIPHLYNGDELIFDVRYDNMSKLYTILYLHKSNNTIAQRITDVNYKVSWAVPVAIEEVIISHRS